MPEKTKSIAMETKKQLPFDSVFNNRSALLCYDTSLQKFFSQDVSLKDCKEIGIERIFEDIFTISKWIKQIINAEKSYFLFNEKLEIALCVS